MDFSPRSSFQRRNWSLAATGPLRLNRRAFDRAERTKDAAIARFRPKQRAAFRALVIVLTSIRRHRLRLKEPAFGASQHGFEYRLRAHRCFNLDGYPTLVTAPVRASTLVLASSNVTTASPFSGLTSALVTPSIFINDLFTETTQEPQLIPETASVTVLLSANAVVENNTAAVKHAVSNPCSCVIRASQVHLARRIGH